MESTLRERFLAKIDKSPGFGPRGDCWRWTGSLDPKGYGQIYYKENHVPLKTHRVSFIVHYGPIPKGLVVRHDCDNPTCVNPAHLLLGTTKDNVRDMLDRGRDNRSNNKYGEDHCQAKVTKAQVDEIRTRYMYGNITQVQLGEEYGLSQCSISDIVRGATWKK